MIDKDKLTSLVEDVKYIIGCLWDALVFDDRRYIRDSLDRLLRSSIAQSKSIQGLDGIKELASRDDPSIVSAGQLRQAKLEVENTASSTGGAWKSKSRSAKVKALRLKQSMLNDRIVLLNGRGIAKYANRYYLAEEKSLIGSQAERQKSLFRAENIAILLHETVSDNFHTLKCKGFLKNESDGILQFLYELPQFDAMTQGQPAPEPSGVSVFDLANLLITRQVLVPEIGLRLRWCTRIAETLLQLHTAGWVHKGVLPESIIWIHTSDSGKWFNSPDFNDHALADRMSAIHGPYLMGFLFARQNSPSEFSENPSSSDARARAYRHADIIGQTRPSFHARYDIYALGIILTEIGLWSGIENVLDRHLDDVPKFMSQDSILQALERKLATNLPRKFVNSVMMALRYKGQGKEILEKAAVLMSSNELIDENFEDEDEDVKVIDIQQTIVSNLKACLEAF